MFKRAWADYEDDEELPPLPWILIPVKPKPQAVKPFNNKFWLLDLEEDSEEEFDEDYCIGCETGADCESAHTCCNCK